MIPTSEGVWRWKRKDDEREFDLPIFNVGVGELYLRIYFLGAYYDVDDFINGNWLAKVSHSPLGHITTQHGGWVHPDDYVFTATA